jgi:NAD(P)H dehydrogenase (quinone)
MKHAVVFAHPNPASLTAAMAGAYAEAARELGHEVVLRDLYAMGFDPCLRAGEIPGPHGVSAGKDVVAERARLADVNVFAFVYPLWFNAPPAILKGYVDRVFGMGFGYGPAAAGGNEPLLEVRRLISISLSGAPDRWVRETGALQALTTLFDLHLAQMCGLTLVDHLHFGDITPGVTEDAAADLLAQVRAAVADRFGASAPYVVA